MEYMETSMQLIMTIFQKEENITNTCIKANI